MLHNYPTTILRINKFGKSLVFNEPGYKGLVTSF